MYKIGYPQYLASIIPGTVTEVTEEKEKGTEPPLTMLPRQTEKEEAVFTTSGPQEETTEEDKFTTETTSTIPTEYPTSSLVTKTTPIALTEVQSTEQDIFESIKVVTKYPESMSAPTPTYTYPEPDQTSEPTPSEPDYLEEIKTTSLVFLSESINTTPETLEIPETAEPQLLPGAPSSPESDPVELHYTPEPRFSPNAPRVTESDQIEPIYTSPDQVQQVPPYSRSHQPQIVVVDEDLNVDGIIQNSQNTRGFNIQTKLSIVMSICCALFCLQCFLIILRRAHTTDTDALLLRTAAIIPTATAANVGLVFMEMGKTVSQKVRFNTNP